MNPKESPIRVGLVGAAGRGGTFRNAIEANGGRIQAVCDIRADPLDECARRLGAPQQFTDYRQMLDQSQLDAVVIGTPMQFHASMAIAALQRNLHVLSEVPAGVSIDECRQLVAASVSSKAIYMMAENYTYMRPNVLVRELCKQGLFGPLYYAEGEYLHELKGLNETTPWRRTWQTGIAGVTYGTHSLGPILQWMNGDRVIKVCCADTDWRNHDPRGESYAQTTPVMLCKTARGALIKIRVDMLSDRPHAAANYQLQGADGCYESSRGGPVDRGRIWLRHLGKDVRWHDVESLMNIDELAGRYLPDIWRNPPAGAAQAGHGGGDFFEVCDFFNAVRGSAPCPIGIHEAMDMTLPGLISQQSVQVGGAWLDVPNSRQWLEAPKPRQLCMTWPREKLDTPPAVKIADGYELRQFAPADTTAYIELLAKAGFADWTPQRVADTMRTVLPGGAFLAVHRKTGRLVATALAQHLPAEGHPHGGMLGWVAGDPIHNGHGLGTTVSAAATARLLAAGYDDISLSTDDFRLPALKIYLKMGWRPLMISDGMIERWQAIYEKLRLHADCRQTLTPT